MTGLTVVRLVLPETVTVAQMAQLELVFSELLDAEATAHLRDGGGDWLIEAIFIDPPAADMMDDLLAPQFAAIGLAPMPVTVQPLADRDWLAENRAAFPPRHLGRYWVHGSHVTDPPPAASWRLLVEAAQAFGSGTHPTTEGCLRACEAVLRHREKRRWNVLDMGCGSAILALGAIRARPAARVVAADNDPIAVRTAAENRRVNFIAPAQMRAVVSTGFSARPVRRGAPYDLVFANILAGPLCRMAADLVPAVAPRGWIILSGILNEQADMVEARFAQHGARRAMRMVIGEWTTLVMRPARLGLHRAVWQGRNHHQWSREAD